jgi:hypothetical protein
MASGAAPQKKAGARHRRLLCNRGAQAGRRTPLLLGDAVESSKGSATQPAATISFVTLTPLPPPPPISLCAGPLPTHPPPYSKCARPHATRARPSHAAPRAAARRRRARRGGPWARRRHVRVRVRVRVPAAWERCWPRLHCSRRGAVRNEKGGTSLPMPRHARHARRAAAEQCAAHAAPDAALAGGWRTCLQVGACWVLGCCWVLVCVVESRAAAGGSMALRALYIKGRRECTDAHPDAEQQAKAQADGRRMAHAHAWRTAWSARVSLASRAQPCRGEIVAPHTHSSGHREREGRHLKPHRRAAPGSLCFPHGPSKRQGRRQRRWTERGQRVRSSELAGPHPPPHPQRRGTFSRPLLPRLRAPAAASFSAPLRLLALPLRHTIKTERRERCAARARRRDCRGSAAALLR